MNPIKRSRNFFAESKQPHVVSSDSWIFQKADMIGDIQEDPNPVEIEMRTINGNSNGTSNGNTNGRGNGSSNGGCNGRSNGNSNCHSNGSDEELDCVAPASAPVASDKPNW